jgi:hypothetical protein
MSSEERWKRLIYRWTTQKGLLAMLSFFILAIIIEYLIVTSFIASGLTDRYLLTQTFQIPGTTIMFILSISPLFHLIPIGIMIFLGATWVYLTKYVAIVPQRKESTRKASAISKGRYQKSKSKRFKIFRDISRNLGKRFEKIDKRFKTLSNHVTSALFRIPGVSRLSQRLSFARAAVKSSVTVFLLFIISVFGLYLLVQPTAIYNVVVGLYSGNQSLAFTIKGICDGIAASPLGGISNALAGSAVWFWNTFQGLGKLTESLVQIDLVWKYLICQNIAAWVSAFVVLIYSRYGSQLSRRKGK